MLRRLLESHRRLELARSNFVMRCRLLLVAILLGALVIPADAGSDDHYYGSRGNIQNPDGSGSGSTPAGSANPADRKIAEDARREALAKRAADQKLSPDQREKAKKEIEALDKVRAAEKEQADAAEAERRLLNGPDRGTHKVADFVRQPDGSIKQVWKDVPNDPKAGVFVPPTEEQKAAAAQRVVNANQALNRAKNEQAKSAVESARNAAQELKDARAGGNTQEIEKAKQNLAMEKYNRALNPDKPVLAPNADEAAAMDRLYAAKNNGKVRSGGPAEDQALIDQTKALMTRNAPPDKASTDQALNNLAADNQDQSLDEANGSLLGKLAKGAGDISDALERYGKGSNLASKTFDAAVDATSSILGKAKEGARISGALDAVKSVPGVKLGADVAGDVFGAIKQAATKGVDALDAVATNAARYAAIKGLKDAGVSDAEIVRRTSAFDKEAANNFKAVKPIQTTAADLAMNIALPIGVARASEALGATGRAAKALAAAREAVPALDRAITATADAARTLEPIRPFARRIIPATDLARDAGSAVNKALDALGNTRAGRAVKDLASFDVSVALKNAGRGLRTDVADVTDALGDVAKEARSTLPGGDRYKRWQAEDYGAPTTPTAKAMTTLEKAAARNAYIEDNANRLAASEARSVVPKTLRDAIAPRDRRLLARDPTQIQLENTATDIQLENQFRRYPNDPPPSELVARFNRTGKTLRDLRRATSAGEVMIPDILTNGVEKLQDVYHSAKRYVKSNVLGVEEKVVSSGANEGNVIRGTERRAVERAGVVEPRRSSSADIRASEAERLTPEYQARAADRRKFIQGNIKSAANTELDLAVERAVATANKLSPEELMQNYNNANARVGIAAPDPSIVSADGRLIKRRVVLPDRRVLDNTAIDREVERVVTHVNSLSDQEVMAKYNRTRVEQAQAFDADLAGLKYAKAATDPNRAALADLAKYGDADLAGVVYPSRATLDARKADAAFGAQLAKLNEGGSLAAGEHKFSAADVMSKYDRARFNSTSIVEQEQNASRSKVLLNEARARDMAKYLKVKAE